jgi:single-stranded-DNA-specific exonuclease
MLNAIAFRAVGQPLGRALLERRGQPVHAAGTLSIDRWNGAERVQLTLQDIAPADPTAAGGPDNSSARQHHLHK